MTLKLGMRLGVHEYYHICSNDDSGLTLTYFMAISNLLPHAFVWEKGKTMNIKGQGHSLTLVQGHSDSTYLNFFS